MLPFERVSARRGRVALILALLAACPPLVTAPAAAHAIILESIPPRDAVLARPPERVVLRFNSQIEKRLARVTLAGEDGRPQPISIASNGALADQQPDRIVIPLRPLPPGQYVIRYKILSADGHVTEGAFRFSVNPKP